MRFGWIRLCCSKLRWIKCRTQCLNQNARLCQKWRHFLTSHDWTRTNDNWPTWLLDGEAKGEGDCCCPVAKVVAAGQSVNVAKSALGWRVAIYYCRPVDRTGLDGFLSRQNAAIEYWHQCLSIRQWFHHQQGKKHFSPKLVHQMLVVNQKLGVER